MATIKKTVHFSAVPMLARKMTSMTRTWLCLRSVVFIFHYFCQMMHRNQTDSFNLVPFSSFFQEELDIRPKVSSLLSRLVSYTNITQGAKEHEEEESAQASRRKTPKVSSLGHDGGTLCLTVFVTYLETLSSTSGSLLAPSRLRYPNSSFVLRLAD